MLELRNITKDYPVGEGVVHALRGVSLRFRKSEFVSILGQSGCGKTTMLNIIGGLDKYSGGDLIINGVSTKDYKDRDWDTYRNHTIGFVFQSYNLIPHQTVLQNVELALSLSGVPKAQRRERAAAALEKVGLGNQLSKKPSEMSGGQMQRVAIARAIVNNPDIILADEPTGALDSETSVQVMDILKEIASDRLVVMVTHNPELAKEYSTRIVRMLDGQVIDDTMPVTDEEAERELALIPSDGKEQKKPTLSLASSFSLSLKNLVSKKARTALTSFAGSIGIIGIALIYAVSQGTSNYIDTVQQDTLSTYPLTIMADTADMTSMLSAFGSVLMDDTPLPDDTVKEHQLMSQVFAQIGTNDLAAFKAHLDENYEKVEEGVNAVQYSYEVTPQIFTIDVADKLMQVNPSSMFSGMMQASGSGSMDMSAMSSMGAMGGGMFNEMIDNPELLKSQYDVLKGRWPEKYNELIFVLGEKDGISDYMAYGLGLRDQSELTQMMIDVMERQETGPAGEPMLWTYEELMALDFRLLNAADMYRYNASYEVWEDMSGDDAYMNALFENAEKLEVVGIVCAKEGVSASALAQGLAYTSELTKHVIEKSANAEIVKAQMADETIDVFTGVPFTELSESGGGGLDFNDMISIDTDMMQSAFGVDLDMKALLPVMEKHMDGMMEILKTDSSAERDLFLDSAVSLCSDMLTTYVTENSGTIAGIAVIKAGDGLEIAANHMDKEAAANIVSAISAGYNLSAEMVKGTFTQILADAVTNYARSFSTAEEGEEPSALITRETAAAAAESLRLNLGVLARSETMGKAMAIGKQQDKVTGIIENMSADLSEAVGGAFTVDGNKMAAAFNFNMDQEELMRLMQTMSTGGEERSADRNLRSLGYADLDEPFAINIFLTDFAAKERFIDFIETYNDDKENSGNEEQVISYTDITGVLMSSVKTVIDSISYVLIAFVAISLIVSSIMIGVITLISVQERTKEIGVLRALGASKKNVSGMFNAETAIIGFTSGLLGVLITYLMCIPINAILFAISGLATLKAKLPIVVGITLVVISVLLTLISGIIPSKSAAKKDPVVALRSE